MTTPLRPELPQPVPARLRHLPVDGRGYPVPFFVAWPDGKPDHRVADPEKIARAYNQRLCHLCGQRLGTYLAFVIGPMCGINRISAEPPDHRECAEWAVRACPFLSRPKMHRREAGLPENVRDPAGMMLTRNPGVTLLWVTKSYRLIREPGQGVLFAIGDPFDLVFYAEGRIATYTEINESITTGLPLLLEPAAVQGPEAVRVLLAQTNLFRSLLEGRGTPL